MEKKIPYKDNSFDIVMALDVLHHTKDIPPLLKEMARVSKKHVIIKDHAVYGIFSKCLVSFGDYMLNLRYGIKCAFNFPEFQMWKEYFNQANLKLLNEPRDFGFNFWLTERYNPIFKLEKSFK